MRAVSTGRRAGVVATALGLLALAGCSTSAPAPVKALPDGIPLFAAPPPKADCSRIDLSGLRSLAGSDLPDAKTILTYADPAKKSLTWAGCAGPVATTTDGASPSPSASGAADGAGSSDENTQQVVWLVRYATTSEAARSEPLADPLKGEKGVRTLSRTARLGDASARVVLDVHADDRATLVLVTVTDPRTGRDSAECGVVGVPGGNADRVVDWCLTAISGQLVRTGSTLG